MKFACNMAALDPAERTRHGVLLASLGAATTAAVRIESGFELALDRAKMAPREVAEWIELESRCCPFLTFGLEIDDGGSSVALRLRGPEGVEPFIEAELGVHA